MIESKKVVIGEKYPNSRLTVLEVDHRDDKKRVYLKCKCDCGKEKIIYDHNLKSGKTKSCGCLHSEIQKENLTKIAVDDYPKIIQMIDAKMKKKDICEKMGISRETLRQVIMRIEGNEKKYDK